jgi:translation initiation factor 1
MTQKNNSRSGIVYSTDKTLNLNNAEQEEKLLLPQEQHLILKLDKRNRGGKAVTVIEGFIGKTIEETGKYIKIFCGTGGSVKDGQIIIQGDNRDKVMQWLTKNGYGNVKKA